MEPEGNIWVVDGFQANRLGGVAPLLEKCSFLKEYRPLATDAPEYLKYLTEIDELERSAAEMELSIDRRSCELPTGAVTSTRNLEERIQRYSQLNDQIEYYINNSRTLISHIEQNYTSHFVPISPRHQSESLEYLKSVASVLSSKDSIRRSFESPDFVQSMSSLSPLLSDTYLDLSQSLHKCSRFCSAVAQIREIFGRHQDAY